MAPPKASDVLRLRNRYGSPPRSACLKAEPAPAPAPAPAPQRAASLLSDAELDGRYCVLESLGSGGFAAVWKARDLHTGQTVAIKQCIDAFRDDNDARHVWLEIVHQRQAGAHPSVLPILRVLRSESWRDMFLVLPLMSADLQRAMRAGDVAKPAQKRAVTSRLLAAVSYLHEGGLVHRDIKPANVLLREAGGGIDVKLCDFGLARAPGAPLHPSADSLGSLWYRAPEILLGCDYGLSADAWAVGCVVAELWRVGNKVLLLGAAEPQQLAKIFDLLGAPTASDLAALGARSDHPSIAAAAAATPRPLDRVLMAGTPADVAEMFAGLVRLDPTRRLSPAAALRIAPAPAADAPDAVPADDASARFALPAHCPPIGPHTPATVYRDHLLAHVAENGGGAPPAPAASATPLRAPGGASGYTPDGGYRGVLGSPGDESMAA